MIEDKTNYNFDIHKHERKCFYKKNKIEIEFHINTINL